MFGTLGVARAAILALSQAHAAGMMRIHGQSICGFFIRARIQAHISPTRRRLSTRPKPIPNAHRRCFYRSALRRIFGRGAGKPYSRLRKCPCGEVFDMHGPDEVFLHVARITAAERSMMSPLMSVNAKLWYA
jgi:hypothetical protein